MLENKLIHEFRKNPLEKVIVELTNYRGTDFVNIWVYYNASEDGEDWRPSRKGISLSIEHIDELKKGIVKAYEEWHKLTSKAN